MRRPSRGFRVPALIAAAVVCAACGSAVGPPTRTAETAASQPTPSATPAATPTTVPPPPVRVALIVMENHGYSSVVGLPYIRTLVTASSALTDYHAVSHPSLPNYLALSSGSTWGVSDDGYHVLPEQDIGDQLTAAGVSWRAYMESIGSDCRANSGRYAFRHDPFGYYGGRCQTSIVDFSALTGDLTSAAPRFLWITPNLCNDMHDCAPATGDAWLRQVVPSILSSPAMANGLLFITWDEDDGGNGNHVLTLVLGSRSAADPGAAYTHVSLLATIQDLLGVARLPGTAGVTAISLR